MKKIAVFPGSFDPFTTGHENIVARALSLFDEVIVALGENSDKNKMFSLDKRKQIIRDTFKSESRVRVESYSGLTINYCASEGADFLLRGLRNGRDLDFEQAIAQMNKSLNASIETIFLVNEPEYSAINSSIVRDIYRNGGDVSAFIPKGIKLD